MNFFNDTYILKQRVCTSLHKKKKHLNKLKGKRKKIYNDVRQRRYG